MTVPSQSAFLDQIFRDARTRNSWTDRPVPGTLRDLYDLVKLGPTSANASPARFLFLTSKSANARLAPHLSSSNRAKSLTAPVVVVIGYDLAFAERLPHLFPHAAGAKDWFADPGVARETAFRNGSLQGAYLVIAARAMGLDCGPMSGFDVAAVDEAFFKGSAVRSNFICNLGYGNDDDLFPRNPRLTFEEACAIL